MRIPIAATAIALAATTTGCGSAVAVGGPHAPQPAGATASSSAPTSTVSPTPSPPPSPTTPPSTTSQAPHDAGKVVVLDPGHDGGNASHPEEINKLVPAGRGRRKACNTTGTETNGGYPEHAFNWDVALRTRKALLAKGFTVIMTRETDTGVGPCVNQRAAIGNRADAAAVVSIHADGNLGHDNRGFNVEYSSPPLNTQQGVPSLRLAVTLRNALRDAGFPLSNYTGSRGLYGRDDLGGLNLSQRPSVLLECGNMHDPADAELLTSANGRQHYADAITSAIAGYLH